MRLGAVWAGVMLMAAMVAAGPAARALAAAPPHVPGEILLKLKDEAPTSAAGALKPGAPPAWPASLRGF